MQKKDPFIYIILSFLAIFGIWQQGFLGGIFTGASLMMLLLVVVGRKVAETSARKIDKQIKDMIVNRQISDEQ